MPNEIQAKLRRAVKDLQAGKPIMLYDYDGREEETDIIYYGPTIEPRSIAYLRYTAGAPLSVYTDSETGNALGLVTFQALVDGLDGPNYGRLKSLAAPATGFDPRFAITLDHRSNRTGCSHLETANTISKLAALIEHRDFATFETEFRSPGHVPLIIAADGFLRARNGHTELILRIGEIGGLQPLMVASEFLDAYTCRSLSKERAFEFAALQDIVFITGVEVESYQGHKIDE
jgi:3,4-dihydroxy 2-butanone 4-phosphate synthase